MGPRSLGPVGDDLEIHWYCSCGLTRQVMDAAVAHQLEGTLFTCQFCDTAVGPVYESEELIRHGVEAEGEGC